MFRESNLLRKLLMRICLLAWVLMGTVSAVTAAPTGEELLAGADARIEKHRKADATVVVLDPAGNPLPDVKVTIEQTRHAFLFGSNIFVWGNCSDEKSEAAYRRRFDDLLNFATLAFYWPMYEHEQGKPRHDPTEKVARWCQEHGIATKGHPLAWNFRDPPWLPDDLEQIRQLQMTRIEDCVARFPGLIDRWDVVNEATHYDRSEFADRQAPKHTAMWKQVGQIEFTRQCFTHARKVGPKATLLINDYRTDPAYERVIEQLVDEDGARQYDVIGIQSHMHGGTWPTEKIWEVCERFARFGVPLHFTEATVVSGKLGWQLGEGKPWDSTPEGEAYQAREVVRFYTMLFSHPAVEAITWWDFSDYHAWQGAPAGFLRKDMTPKPAYDELKKLIKGRWWTKLEAESDAAGEVDFRGFLGDYRITVTAAGKEPIQKTFVLSSGDQNRVEVSVE